MAIFFKYSARRTISAISNGTLLKELKQRGLISNISQPEHLLQAKLENNEKIKLYCGADPTARSLHLGNMVPLMILLNFYVRGHDIVGLVGGATGRVGDPSGRNTERNSMEDRTRLDNINFISQQLEHFFANGLKYWKNKNYSKEVKAGKFEKVDNYEWWKDIRMLDFLAQYGRHVRVQSMLSRDSVSSRLSTSTGIGFNEFTYQILQAYDFYHLHKTRNVTIQVGGGDQWGNITAGIDLISRIDSVGKTPTAFGITTPLLTTSTGEKFGKSAGNAVFIDPKINTAYDIFQFFYNTIDSDVRRFLNIFTLLQQEEINTIMIRHEENPELREGQKILAKEVTEMLHGIGSGSAAQSVSGIIFNNSDSKDIITAGELKKVFNDAGILKTADKNEPLTSLISRLTECSKSEAKRKITQGCVYLNITREKVTEDISNYEEYLIDDEVLMLRIGKQKCFVIQINE